MKLLDIELFTASIKNLPVEKNVMVSSLSNEEKLKMDSYYHYNDKIRFLLSRYMLKQQLSKYLNIDIEAILLKYSVHGKPYFKNKHGVEFNISHSENIVIVAFYGDNIGIDVQHHHPIEEDFINESFLTKNEISYLNSLEDNDKTLEFYRIWTIKEAYIKAIGIGMYMDLKSIDITNPEPLKYNGKKYIIALTNINPSYSCAVCYPGSKMKKADIIHKNYYLQSL